MSGRLRLYVRAGCSLCEAMQLELKPMQARYGFELDVVDIDKSDKHVRAYGEKVPVLCGSNGEICHYFLDPERLENYFAVD